MKDPVWPPINTVTSGASVTIIAPAGSDYDTRSRLPEGGEQVDDGPLKHIWEGGTGGQLTTNDASASWRAPNTVPAGGLTTTITCTLDDGWTGDETGVPAPDTGTRNDAPGTQVSVTIQVQPAGCGQWQHKSWDEVDHIEWVNDGNGVPQPQTPQATEHIEWKNPCDDNDHKDDDSVTVGYTLLKDHIVESGDEAYRVVTYQAFSLYSGPPTAEITDSKLIPWRWNPNPGIKGGELSPVPPSLEVAAGTTIQLHAGMAWDEDTWSRNGSTRQGQDEGIRYTRGVAGGGGLTESSDHLTVTYTAPLVQDVPEGDAGLEITVSLAIDDSLNDGESGVEAPDTGDRNDDGADGEEVECGEIVSVNKGLRHFFGELEGSRGIARGGRGIGIGILECNRLHMSWFLRQARWLSRRQFPSDMGE